MKGKSCDNCNHWADATGKHHALQDGNGACMNTADTDSGHCGCVRFELIDQ